MDNEGHCYKNLINNFVLSNIDFHAKQHNIFDKSIWMLNGIVFILYACLPFMFHLAPQNSLTHFYGWLFLTLWCLSPIYLPFAEKKAIIHQNIINFLIHYNLQENNRISYYNLQKQYNRLST